MPVLDPEHHVVENFCAMDGRVRDWTAAEIETLKTLALAAGGEIALRLALRTADRHAAEAAELAQVLEHSLIPAEPPEIPGVGIGTLFRACGSGVEVMGDFYDVVPTPTGFGVVIGDVCGRGALAARSTAMARAAVRTAAHSESDPAAVLAALIPPNDLRRHGPERPRSHRENLHASLAQNSIVGYNLSRHLR